LRGNRSIMRPLYPAPSTSSEKENQIERKTEHDASTLNQQPSTSSEKENQIERKTEHDASTLNQPPSTSKITETPNIKQQK
jgi:hypothetical protein